MKTQFDYSQLPLEALGQLGLISRGKLRLSPVDIAALLTGRRTNLLGFENLKAEGIKIAHIQLRLSLKGSQDGPVSLMLHPIYKRPLPHPLLEPFEADLMVDGDIDSLAKTFEKGERKGQTMVVEFDRDTRSFVSYNAKDVLVPISINGIVLDRQQSEDYRNGVGIDLGDGTLVQYRASEAIGLWANRQALVLSFGDAASPMVLHGIGNFPSHQDPQLPHETNAFLDALAETKAESYTAQFSALDIAGTYDLGPKR